MKNLLSFLFFFSAALSLSFAELPPSEQKESPEQKEYKVALQKALTDPSVQSTREIARMAIHKAMLRADPSLETLFANLDTRGPEGMPTISDKKKNVGDQFEEWLANYSPTVTKNLTSTDLQRLKAAHAKAMEDPAVRDALKIARLTFYNAMINADPLIAPILAKMGIPTPKSVQPLSQGSKVGSEEKILGGDVQSWGEEVLAPALPAKQGKSQ